MFALSRTGSIVLVACIAVLDVFAAAHPYAKIRNPIFHSQHRIFGVIERDDVDALKQLVIGTDNWQSEVNLTGETPLHYAVNLGNFAVVSVLLSHEADANALARISPRQRTLGKSVSAFFKTPLAVLVEKREVRDTDLPIFDLLLQRGAPDNEVELKKHIGTIKRNLGIDDIVYDESSSSSAHASSSSSSLPNACVTMTIPDFARAQFDYLRTHLGSVDFEHAKKTWPIYGSGSCFVALIRDVLSEHSNQASIDAVLEMLHDPELWLFPEGIPARHELKQILDNIEPLLDDYQFLRLLFITQQIFYRSAGSTANASTPPSALDASYDDSKLGEVTPKDAVHAVMAYKGKSAQLAEQLCALDRENYLAIPPLAFVRHVLKLTSHDAYNYYRNFGNGIKSLVITSILLAEREKRDPHRTFNFWVKVADKLIVEDFFGAANIVSGLTSVEVSRLGIGTDRHHRLSHLMRLISSDKRYRRYRKEKAERLAKREAFIPLGGPESNDISLNGELPDKVMRIPGQKVFNLEKCKGFHRLITELTKVHRALEVRAREKVTIDTTIRRACEVTSEDYARFLSYALKPFSLPMAGDKILPHWSNLDLFDWYCATVKRIGELHADETGFFNTVEQAVLHGLNDGISLFYSYLAWQAAWKETCPEDDSKWQAQFFLALNAAFPNGIIGTIRAFSEDGPGDIFYIGSRSKYAPHMAASDREDEKRLAMIRWIIHFVKSDMVQELILLKKQNIVDTDGFIKAFSPYAHDVEQSEIKHNELHEALKGSGITKFGKRILLHRLLRLLTTNESEQDSSR